MRRQGLNIFFGAVLLTAGLGFVGLGQGIPVPPTGTGQESNEPKKFADQEAGFEIELPPGWRAENSIDNSGKRSLEIIYRDRSQSLMKAKKETVPADDKACLETPVSCFIDREVEGSLRFRPEFTGLKQERFSSPVARGTLVSFSFRKVGKPTTARYYYLQTAKDTVWVLRFEGEKRFHDTLRYQTDKVAYTFRPLP